MTIRTVGKALALSIMLALSMVGQSGLALTSTESLRLSRSQVSTDEWLTSATTTDQGRFLILSTIPLPTTGAVDVMVFATPNGNTAEQTFGDTDTSGTRWRYGIQHIAGQWRHLRIQGSSGETPSVLVCVEAPKLSWPTAVRVGPPEKILGLFETIRREISPQARFRHLAAHSGGGALLHAVMAAESTPTLTRVLPEVESLIFLDANYAFQDSIHGQHLANWLRHRDTNRLVALSYDDRTIELQGKRVVGPTGGTLRANLRMAESLTSQGITLTTTVNQGTTQSVGLKGRVRLETLENPKNKILHTVLVERNGLLYAWDPSLFSLWMKDPAYKASVRPLCPSESASQKPE